MMNPLHYQAVARPTAPFLTWPTSPEPLTFEAASMAARRWAAAFGEVQAAPRDRIAIIGDNSVDWVTAALGALWAGLTIIPINTRLPHDQIVSLIDELDPRAVVTLGDWRQHSFTDRPHVTEPGRQLARSSPFDPDACATIFFTSGTTGRPKPVPHTWNQHVASAAASAFNLGVVPGDNWLCTLPLFHIGGLAIIFRSLIYGTSVTLHDRFDPDAVLASLRGGVTLASFVPTILGRLIDSNPSALADSRLRAILLGGGPANAELLNAAADLDLPLFQTYGMTEAASQITTMPPAAARSRIGSAGLPIQGAAVQIRDEASSPVPAQTVGNIWVRGPMITHGYLARPDANQQVFRDGWFFTGDFGRLDEDGFLWVESRRDDLIVTGGENVYPAQVESLIATHHAVDDVAIVGRPDHEWGERVVAFVVSTLDPDDRDSLDAFARQVLAPFQLPREWHFVDELPRNPSGKILRRELRERLIDPRDGSANHR